MFITINNKNDRTNVIQQQQQMIYLFNNKTNHHHHHQPLLLLPTSSEIARVRASLFQINGDEHKPLILPEPDGPIVNKMEKVYVPVDEHPDFNFVGRILGPRGMTAKQLEQETGCKIMVRGRGSMRDKKKEEQNRGKPNWEHLNDKLHVLITVEDTENRAIAKMERAIEEVKKLLVPITEGEDELKKRQLMELAIINGTYRDSGQRNSAIAAATAAAAAATSPNLVSAQHLVNLGLDPEQLNAYATGGGTGGVPIALAAAAAAAAATTHPHQIRHHPHHLTTGHPGHHHQPSPIGAPLILAGTPTARQFAHPAAAAATPLPHQSALVHHLHYGQALLNGNSAAASIPPQLITATSTPDGTLLYTTNVHPSALNPHHPHQTHHHQYAATAAEFHHQYSASLAAAQLLDYQAAAAVAAAGAPVITPEQSGTSVSASTATGSSASSSSATSGGLTTYGLKEKRQTGNPSNGLRNAAIMSAALTTGAVSVGSPNHNHRYHPYDHHHLMRAASSS
ncbi:hypothetical protein DERF_010225 [Dermatophagoides farinae]|uniref:K Homology domain-containing protein n=1 Tax=Dermatophagoides farinae TaxID=6954 RepID=A0A922HYI8_DERFA|nr:hypothetical protein DERF_010225 [Dermatophagoides farinae]